MKEETYQKNELDRAFKTIDRITGYGSGKAAKIKEIADFMKDPEAYADRVEWLFNGSYGAGVVILVDRIMKQSNRFNKVAALSANLVMFDCFAPASYAADAYKTLTRKEQKAIDGSLIRVIEAQAKAGPCFKIVI